VDVFVNVRHPVLKTLNSYLEAIFGSEVYNRSTPAPLEVRQAAMGVMKSIPRLNSYGDPNIKDYQLAERWDELEAVAKRHLSPEEAQKLDETREELERVIEVYGASENEDTAAAQRLTKLILGAHHAVSFLPDVKLEHLVTTLISSRDRFLETAASSDLQTFINDAESFLDDPKAMRTFFAIRRKGDLPEAKLLLAELSSKLA